MRAERPRPRRTAVKSCPAKPPVWLRSFTLQYVARGGPPGEEVIIVEVEELGYAPAAPSQEPRRPVLLQKAIASVAAATGQKATSSREPKKLRTGAEAAESHDDAPIAPGNGSVGGLSGESGGALPSGKGTGGTGADADSGLNPRKVFSGFSAAAAAAKLQELKAQTQNRFVFRKDSGEKAAETVQDSPSPNPISSKDTSAHGGNGAVASDPSDSAATTVPARGSLPAPPPRLAALATAKITRQAASTETTADLVAQPQAADGSDEEHKREAKEVLNKLLIAKKKELLKLQMAASEKQLAALRARAFLERSPPKKDAKSAPPPALPVAPRVRRNEEQNSSPQGPAVVLVPPRAKDAERFKEQRDKLHKALERRQLLRDMVATTGNGSISGSEDPGMQESTFRVSESEARSDQPQLRRSSRDGTSTRRRVSGTRKVRKAIRHPPAVLLAPAGGRKRRRSSGAEVLRSESSHSRSQSVSMGGASDDSDAQRHWRGEEPRWRMESAPRAEVGRLL